MKLFVGSHSPAPEGWVSAASFEDAKQYLLNETIDELHIEDIIGADPEGGLRLIDLIKDQVKFNNYTPPITISPISNDNDRLFIMRNKTNRIFCYAANRELISGNEPLWVYLGDLRVPPKWWFLTDTPEETMELLKTRRVVKLSLDNDLGLDSAENGRPR